MAGWTPWARIPERDLVVLNYHGTQRRFMRNLEEQLSFYRSNFRVISPADLDSFFGTQVSAAGGPLLLLNFDDGIRNNLYAADLLERTGIHAFFHVVPAFIDTPEEEQSRYFIERIRPSIDPEIDAKPEDLTAMSWQDLGDLARAGHEVGSHSFTHLLRLQGLSSDSRRREIVDSRRRIAAGCGIAPDKVRAFCGPFDSLLSCGTAELALILDNYEYFFSTLYGSNCHPKDPYFIKRSNVEAFWSLEAVKFATGGLNRLRWRGRLMSFQNTLQKARRLSCGTQQGL